MKIAYRKIALSKANKERLTQINTIIEEYRANDYILTLRQLYYQLVSRGIIANQLSEYAKLSTLLKEGRMSGIVDWAAIEDRLRVPEKPASWSSPKQIMNSVIYSYALPRQKDQYNYMEVWVEKDALSGVLSRVTEPYHIPIMVNRGYSSATAMHDAFKRFQNAANEGQSIKLIYVGDYDPSGLNMIDDIKKRIKEFDADDELNFEIIPIALTRQQIDQYAPPPNPAKKSDPRAKKFIKAFGTQSWEVDALRPEVLNQILEDAIDMFLDRDIYLEILEEEKKDIERLEKLKDKL